jgi:CHAD domain-containing protein
VETPLRDDAGRTLALVAQDQVTAETDGAEQRWQEVEVELVDGGPKVLDSVERELRRAGAEPAEGPSKLARALGDRLTARDAERTKTKINPVPAYAREQRDAIVAYDPGVRAGNPEAVHKMRVATRRLRSTLRTFKRSFPADRAEFLKTELKWLAGQLGEVRDGQVLEHKLLSAVDREGPDFTGVAERIRAHLDAKVAAGREALVGDLDGERYLRLLDAVDDLVDADDAGEPKPLRRARKALDKADRLLDEATLRGTDEPVHEARKAYKQARYAVEVFVRSGGKPAKRLVDRLTDLQDVLGAHQDSVVAREILHDLSRESDAFRYGILWARQEQIGRDTMGNLPGVIWPSRTRKLRRWLD